MSDLLSTVRRQIEGSFSKTSKKQKIYFGVGVVAAMAIIAVLSMVFGQEEYEGLYTGLETSEAGEIMQRREDMGVEAKAQGSNTILVLSDAADEVRMTLAAQGYPETGLNYDIFADSSSLGTTDLQTQTYLQYQLQENLRATILKLKRIEDCVVMVNMPSESLFVLSSDETEATASVMVEIKDGGTLTNEEVQAIANLILKSVSGLKMENISIVDSNMNLYDVTGESGEEYSTTQYDLTQLTKETYEQQVLSVLTPVFGKDNVSAAVNVVLNFDQETVSSVAFDTPLEDDENGLVVSMEELYEKTQGDGAAEGTAGTDSNGVALSEYVFQDADINDFQKISRTVNYELNELQTQIVKQQGSIDKLSVAVLLNSGFHDEDYSDSIISLVSKAIGVDEASVSVESLPFLDTEESEGVSDIFDKQASLLGSLKNKDLLKTLIISGTIMLLCLFVLRFLYAILRGGKAVSDATVEGTGVVLEEDGAEENLLEIARSAKSKSKDKIEGFVEKNPGAAAQLLRNWLSDEDV